MGFLILVALAILIAAGTGEGSRLWAIPLVILAIVFVPAIVVSLRPVPQRRRILRIVLVASLVLALAGVPIYGLELPIVLSPAVGLLAQAAGFIFTGGSPSR
jgi:hypothetical protein